MNFNILITTQMMIHEQDRFAEWLNSLGCKVDFVMNDQYLSESQCLALNNCYDGWIAGDDQITKAVIDHFQPRLKVISKWGSGIDSIDLLHAKSTGLTIANSPGAFQDSVGEMAVGYLLALTRGLIHTHTEVLNFRWPKTRYRTLIGMKVGIVGFGAIGQGVASRLESLGCEVHYSDPNVDTHYYIKQNLADLVALNESIIITCALNDSTRGLFDNDVLTGMRENSYLINVSRGPIINEQALLSSLKEGKFAGVALDVYEVEPLATLSPLRDFENVIFGSHNANNTIDAVEFVHKNTIDELINTLKENL
jgi:D-3-phosphoglycerate dehydrogenase